MSIDAGEDLKAMAAKSGGLARDLAYIRDNGRPDDAILRNAPILNRWTMAFAPTACLIGSVSGHPRLGTSPLIHTSELIAIDELAGWARTWSRFYRLGIPRDGLQGGGSA